MRIVVAGGTGVVGRQVVETARARGHEAVALARSTGTDLRTGIGVTRALADADAVIDVLSTQTLDAGASTAFFGSTTRALQEAERAAGVPHHLALSIVGVDRAPYGYYAGKLAQERLVADGAVPWTILRATQFHEFAAQTYARGALGPFHVAPRMRTQPVSSREVAERLVTLAEDGPRGRARDLAGPREESLAGMVRAYARSIGSRAWLPAVTLPGAFGRAMRDGRLLPGPDADLGAETFARWLARRR